MNGPLETTSTDADGRTALSPEDELAALRARVEELERESAERKWMDDALKALAFGTASATGHEFLQQLVRQLSATLHVPYVFVTELVPGKMDRVRTVAGWYRDRPAPLLEYALADSPCLNVIRHGPVFIPYQVRHLFPKDEYLTRLNLESYMGVPLLNGAGQTTGHLCVTDTRPFRFNRSQGSPIITAFAERAAAELERLRAEDTLRQNEERFRALYDDNPSMYFTLSTTGTVLSVNSFGAEQLGYAKDALVGQPVLAVFDPQDHRTVLDQLAACAANPFRTFEWELQKIRKDGSHIWVRERARAVIGTNGHISILVGCSDITAQHQALEFLRDSEARWKILFEQSAIGMAQLALSGRFLQVNPVLARILGYPHEEILAKSFQEITHPDDLAINLRLMDDLLAGSRACFSMEKRCRRADGTLIWVAFTVSLVRNQTGTPAYFIAVVENIADRKQAEADLRESEGRLRAFATTIPDLALVLDEQGRYVDILSQETHLLYADASLLKGRLLHDVLPRADAGLFLSTIRRTIETGQSQRLEYPLTVQAGVRWFEGRTSLMPPVPGKLQQVVWVAGDITERKQTEELLRVSEERFAKAFRSSPHPVIVTERETGLCLEVNDAGLALFGYRREEVIGQTVLTLRLWATPEDRARFFARLALAGTLRNVEMEFYTKDRTPRHCLISCEPIEIGGKACLVTVGTDITEQKRAEEAVRRQEHILQKTREERERISQDLHDNILQSLYAVGMQLEASKLVASASARKSKTHITQAIAQLNQLVQDVRHFIALLHQRNAPNIDVERALRQLIATFSSAGQAATTLHIQPEALPLITAHVGEQLVSIAREALSNSMRHAKAGTRSMTLRLIGSIIQLCVTDDGIGFKPGQKRRRGQGLKNMATRAAHIGARFLLASAPGQGTSIIVEVPLEKAV